MEVLFAKNKMPKIIIILAYCSGQNAQDLDTIPYLRMPGTWTSAIVQCLLVLRSGINAGIRGLKALRSTGEEYSEIVKIPFDLKAI